MLNIVKGHSLQLWPHPSLFPLFLVCLRSYVSFSKSGLCHTQTFLGLCLGYGQYVTFVPPDKPADIQQLALYLLQKHHVTVHQVVSFLGKANFCASGHSQLW